MKLAISVLTIGCLLVAAATSLAQKPAAPFYALPAAGAWAEYDCTDRDKAGKETRGTLRIGHVGVAEIDRQPHAWIEIKLTPDSKSPEQWKLRKLLVAVERHRATGDLTKSVVEAHQQGGPNQPSRPLADAQLRSFLQMGWSGVLALKKQDAEQELATPAGKWRCQQWQGRLTEGTKSAVYTAWLCDQAAFNLCQFTMTVEHGGPAARSEFRAVLARTGAMAQPELKLPAK